MRWTPIDPATTVILFVVRVPVLSVQTCYESEMSVIRRKGIDVRDTYASSIGHGFTGTEDTNEEVHLGHTTSGESESTTSGD